MRKTKSFVSVLLVVCLLFAFPGISFGAAQMADDGAAARGVGGDQGNNQGNIVSVSADTGTVNAKFNKQPPGGKPKASDFTIQRQVNGGAAEVIIPTSYTWGPSAKIATFAVPSLASGSLGLEVVYSVSFKGAAFVSAPAFAISAWPPLDIVHKGQANAMIVVAPDADEQTQAAADTLAEYVLKSTGAQLPVITEDQLSGDNGQLQDQVRIHIGANGSQQDPHLDELLQAVDADGDGYVIHFHENEIVIAGSSVWGTKNGVFDFLERYVGVRWLMPGPDGEDVPQTTDLTIERSDILENPAFIQRVVSPMVTSPDEAHPLQSQNEWAQRNRLQGKYNMPVGFHHNLYSLFPVEWYGSTRPDFYPKSIPPNPGAAASWQPCFSADGSVEAAVYGILQYFAANPDASSFSLGVNDSGNYCETDSNHPLYPDRINSVGRIHMSEIYYKWVNDVVEQVLEVYPDKWFGLLAYEEVNDPPAFPLNPRVVPFVTKDRLSWTDPEVKDVEHGMIEQWEQVAENVGWYDYLYGTLYTIPRIYPHVMAENYRYAKDNHVIAHYAELYGNAGDGPKAWLSAKLQWDPNQDVDALLEEWYERAVGPAAAADLAAYYALWEHYWTEQIQASDWFQIGKNMTYLAFNDLSYLNLVTDDMVTQSRALLEAAVAKAGTPKQKARANVLLRAFEYYEASALSYPKKNDPPASEAEALQLLDHIAETIAGKLAYAQDRLRLLEEFKNDPLLVNPASLRIDWSGWNKYDFWNLIEYIRENEAAGGPVTQKVRELASSEQPSKIRSFAELLEEVLFGWGSVTANASFENGTTTASPWELWVSSTGTIKRTEGMSRTGNASLVVDKLARGGPAQLFSINPGLIAARAYFYTPAGTHHNGTIQLLYNVKDAQGNNLTVLRSEEKAIADTAGEWTSIGILEEVPAAIGGKEVKKIQVVVLINGFAEGSGLYVDDVEVFQKRGSLDPNLVTKDTFWSLYDSINQQEPNGGPKRLYVEALAASPEYSEGREYAKLLANTLSGTQPVNDNPSFEAGTAPWSLFLANGAGTMNRVTDAVYSHSGSAGIVVSGTATQKILNQYFTFNTGPAAAKVFFKIPQGKTTAGTIQLGFNMNTADGKSAGVVRSNVKPLSASNGDWASIDYAFWIPQAINNLEVGRVQFVVIITGLEGTVPIYLDDVNIYQ
ncbi:hypothetical protein DQG23_26120 [Paenibacillus contaminans]|uniref:DUF4838 domain-containing protein n=1 Tax=Paenibacillus contaminans TaxID=450362 RepID=A0A329MJQ2_9BACL|nr:DUF4838 domain-containing protein [Paenibacillus contaminans]RAV17887.1 hypothetical protein DQG23_26120 [Paenibacillus contaminans]